MNIILVILHRFWFKTIEICDITIKSVGDVYTQFGFSSIVLTISIFGDKPIKLVMNKI